MVWFYERSGDLMRCEVHESRGNCRYELTITDPDGHQRIEAFHDSAAVIRRSRELEVRLGAEGWSGPFMRFI
jgi:hypothetical protein